MRRTTSKLLLLAALLIGPMLWPLNAYAFNSYSGVNCNSANSSALCTQSSKSSGNVIYGSNSLLVKATNFIALIAGIAATILIVIGGIQYVTSGGSPESAGNAKRTIIYSLIGIAVIVLAKFIVQYVVNVT
jgi:hypothetical protein